MITFGWKTRADGFTVIELLITLIVGGVVFLAFTTTFAGLGNITQRGRNTSIASASALSKLQQYENKSFNNLPSTSPAGTLVEVEDFSASVPVSLSSPRIGKVYVNSSSTSLKQVVVRISYGSNPRFVEYVTFIQRNGVGR